MNIRFVDPKGMIFKKRMTISTVKEFSARAGRDSIGNHS